MAEIGIVTGMMAEVRALGRWAIDARISVAVSGADPDRAEAAARCFADAGARVLVSWGLAGGLASDLAPGTLIRPAEVICPDGTRIAIAGGKGVLSGSDTVVTSPADKARLRAATGADAVDMESHRLARVARETGLALVVIRAVSDPADRALPALAAQALGPDGRPRSGRVLAGLARRPWELPRLLAAKRDSDRALGALAGAADRMVAPLLAAHR